LSDKPGSTLAGRYDQTYCLNSSVLKVQNDMKEMTMECTISLAHLNLTPEQRKKMDEVMAEHHNAGCTEASEAKYMEEAKIMTTEQ
jgi:hypothetical protein